jgi:hypothetical protein
MATRNLPDRLPDYSAQQATAAEDAAADLLARTLQHIADPLTPWEEVHPVEQQAMLEVAHMTMDTLGLFPQLERVLHEGILGDSEPPAL